MSTLNLNIPKFNWNGVEEPTINHFYKIDDGVISNILLKVRNGSIIKEIKRNETFMHDNPDNRGKP